MSGNTVNQGKKSNFSAIVLMFVFLIGFIGITIGVNILATKDELFAKIVSEIELDPFPLFSITERVLRAWRREDIGVVLVRIDESFHCLDCPLDGQKIGEESILGLRVLNSWIHL